MNEYCYKMGSCMTPELGLSHPLSKDIFIMNEILQNRKITGTDTPYTGIDKMYSYSI